MIASNLNNEPIAQKLLVKNLKNAQRFLVLIGSPFYQILSYILIILLFLSHLATQLVREFSTDSILSLFKNTALLGQKLALKARSNLRIVYRELIKFPKISLTFRRQKVTKPKVKLKTPKLRFKHQLFLIVLTAFFAVFTYSTYILFKDLPSPDRLVNEKPRVSTKIYDRNGEVLYNIYKEENRTPVTLNNIPLRVRLATLAIEDAEFYHHPGFSIRGIIRAAIRNFREGELTGGSTITQQLVKNTLLSPEKTIKRKLREVILAVLVELRFPKDKILEMYLNEVSYGGTAYGIQEASRVYFDKNVDELSLAEAALLAGLPKSPTKYSPFGSNPQSALDRQKEVLNLMLINEYITDEQYQAAVQEEIVFTQNRTSIKAPHFVMYVREVLEEKYGKEVVESGGLEVKTTLDIRMQELAEKVVETEVEKLSNLNVTNGAALVLNPKTGEILAMVGSKDYFDTQSDGNVNVTERLRQPGSSIKAVNYAYALSENFTAASIVKDVPTKFIIEGQPPYSPKNYDGNFRGNLTLRSAFAESRNVPAVKVLSEYGVEHMVDMGKKLGINSWKNPTDYGLSLTLGGGDVTLLELANIYATIANQGKKPNLSTIKKVTNFEGKILEENGCVKQKGSGFRERIQSTLEDLDSDSNCEQEQVIDPRIAYILTDILRDNKARTPAFGSNSLLIIPDHNEVAVKTGTSNNLRDNLAVGYNQDYLVAAWVGNNDNSEMSRIASGVTGATPIWHNIMTSLLTQENSKQWIIPDGIVQLPICKLTGTLTCTGCPTYMEWFLEEKKPETACRPEFIKALIEKHYKKETENVIEQNQRERRRTPRLLENAARTERQD